MTSIMIQITIAIGIFVAGYALGELIRREVVDNVTGERRPRWPWLTPNRVSAVLLVLLAISGITTTYSVRSCQTAYNKAYSQQLKERGVATDLLYDTLDTLFGKVLEPMATPEERATAVREARRQLQQARQVRQDNPLPPLPSC